MYEYKAKVVNIVDGDTFDLEVDLGFRIFHKVRVRLLGIDTPEKFGEERELGEKCKAIAERIWLNENVVIKSEKEEDINTDSFGRWLVKIRLENEDWSSDAVFKYNSLGINKLNPNYSQEKVRNEVH